VDHKAWSESEFLSGEITIDKPGKGHPQGVWAVRTLSTWSISITEDIVGFNAPNYFSYESRDGSLPVNNLWWELFFEKQNWGVLVSYLWGFNPKYFGTGWLFKQLISSGQKWVLKDLKKAYKAHYINY
jgi:hypothetical protein